MKVDMRCADCGKDTSEDLKDCIVNTQWNPYTKRILGLTF